MQRSTPVVYVADPLRKKEKKRHANETFIIVRPPPSKSAHPLNLQVQLVPPRARNDIPVQALDDDLDTDLRRTRLSEASAYSGYTLVSSVPPSNYSGATLVGSVSPSNYSGATLVGSSSSTTGSGRRMIIPCLDLIVNSVLPTTIVDAGTDARVAKFAKLGLEVIGLAFLEPIEVRRSPPASDFLAAPISARASFDDSLREIASTPGTFPSRGPVSPVRSNTSHAPSGGHFHTPTINLTPAPPLPPPDMQPQRSTKKLFTRMFKKRGITSPSIAVPLPDEIIPPQPSPFHNSARRSDEAPPSQPDISHHHDAWLPTSFASTATSQTAVLGVHSTLYPPVNNPRGRPTKYIWVVRKWLKGTDAGVLSGMMGKLSVGARDASVPNTPHIEVRFEWSREQNNGSDRKSRPDRSSNSRESRSPSRSSAHEHAEESGEESDPEDSETPWTCAVTAQRLGQSLQRSQNSIQEPAIRLKVANLSPTPHHPKVVGLLKIPFPLPDIEVERLVIRRRLVTAQGNTKMTAPDTSEFILTAEEIKDTVMSTALWLAVREAFGGVGRERNKGKS
ncbi:hypothetical protein HD554DRAFT_318142 [Boletus coccyginus]|nr:hypothetical protein HD554DRAFT_318142 [Boletus coccyginus]